MQNICALYYKYIFSIVIVNTQSITLIIGIYVIQLLEKKMLQIISIMKKMVEMMETTAKIISELAVTFKVVIVIVIFKVTINLL